METDTKNAALAKAFAFKLSQKATAKIDATREHIDRAFASIERGLEPPAAKDSATTIYHGEIRARLSAMDAKDRMKLLATADDNTVAAATTAAPFLSGMTPEEVAAAKDAWQRRRHPETLDRLARLRKAREALGRSASLFWRWHLNLFESKSAEIAAAERSAELARAAIESAA